jgi:hypothetical protein
VLPNIWLCAGAVAQLPKFTSHKVRQLPDAPDVKPYSDLAAAYSSKNSDRLARVAEQHMAAFNAVSCAVAVLAAAAAARWLPLVCSCGAAVIDIVYLLLEAVCVISLLNLEAVESAC